MPTLERTTSARVFCRLIRNAQPHVKFDDMMQMTLRERDRLGRGFRDHTLRREMQRLFEPKRSRRNKWTPSPLLVREVLKVFNPLEEKLNFLEATERAQSELIRPQFRGDPARRTMIWLRRP